MQCPRCGLHNAAGVVQCARCAHSFTAAEAQQTPPDWQHPGYDLRLRPPQPPPPQPRFSRVSRVLAVIALVAAALSCLGYGGWAIVERRAVFAALADGEAVALETARESDRLQDQLMWTAAVAVAVAVVLWLTAHLIRRKPLGIAGFTALALWALGLLVALGGAYVTSLVQGDVAEAGTAAVGFTVMGIGFLLAAGGAIAALKAVFGRPPRSETPVAGFAGWPTG